MSVNKLRDAIVLHNKRFLLLRDAVAIAYTDNGPRLPPCRSTPGPLGPEFLAYNTNCRGGSAFPISQESCPSHSPQPTGYCIRHPPHTVNTYRHQLCRHGDPPLAEGMAQRSELREQYQTLKAISPYVGSSGCMSHCANSDNVLERKCRHTHSHGENGEDISKPDLVQDVPTPAQLSFVLLKLREEVNILFAGFLSLSTM